jgi:hypothetical protein
MSDGAGEIIIKGGSVELFFNDTTYPKVNGDPKKHENRDRRITSIVVVDENGNEKLNSGDNPGGLKWTVTVKTR